MRAGRPLGRGGGRASAALPLLGDEPHRLRRGALHLLARHSRQNVNVFLANPKPLRFFASRMKGTDFPNNMRSCDCDTVRLVLVHADPASICANELAGRCAHPAGMDPAAEPYPIQLFQA